LFRKIFRKVCQNGRLLSSDTMGLEQKPRRGERA
jgi:hypothetical protein